jgi:hypothetical protein
MQRMNNNGLFSLCLCASVVKLLPSMSDRNDSALHPLYPVRKGDRGFRPLTDASTNPLRRVSKRRMKQRGGQILR